MTKTRQHKVDPMPAMQLAMELTPPSEWSGTTTIVGTCMYWDLCPRTWHRWAKGDVRISVNNADKLAIKLGYHPVEIWGDEWWTY